MLPNKCLNVGKIVNNPLVFRVSLNSIGNDLVLFFFKETSPHINFYCNTKARPTWDTRPGQYINRNARDFNKSNNLSLAFLC